MNLYETAMQELASARRQAERAAAERREEAMRWPGFAERYRRIQRIKVELGRCEARGEDPSALLAERKRLSAELDGICTEHGRSPNEFVPRYACPSCKDTGFVDGQPCFCFKQRMNELAMEQCGLTLQQYPRFEEADFSVFPAQIRAERQALYAKCSRYCREYPDVVYRNLVLLGPPGTGKTWLLKCMAESLINRGRTVLFATAFSLNQVFFRYMNYRDENRELYLERLCRADFLFIDDLGSEADVRNVTGEYLLMILNQRMEDGKPVFVTTNFELDGLNARYGEKIMSRLFNSKQTHLIRMDGEDLRRKRR